VRALVGVLIKCIPLPNLLSSFLPPSLPPSTLYQNTRLLFSILFPKCKTGFFTPLKPKGENITFEP